MSGDPAVVEDAENVPSTLSTADQLTAVTVKLPHFWQNNIKTWLV